jgi:hypothetical protein
MDTNYFDANRWIAKNCIGASQLLPDTVDVISNFTLMWNLFEGTACDNNAKIPRFDKLAEEIGQRGEEIDALDEAVQFWTFRYWSGSEFRGRFDGLNFRKNDRKDHVEAVLRGEKTDTSSKLLAVMIIVYRLRNNLFHGIKEINMLNDQAVNLDMASKTIAAILEASGSYIFQRQPESRRRLQSDVRNVASRRPASG